MFQNRKLGAALIFLGVLANNYVYLHDLILGKYEYYENAIVLSWLAAILIIATLVVTAAALWIVMRSTAPDRKTHWMCLARWMPLPGVDRLHRLLGR